MACFSTSLVRSRHVRSRAKLSHSRRLKQKTMAYSNTGVFGEGRGEDSVGYQGHANMLRGEHHWQVCCATDENTTCDHSTRGCSKGESTTQLPSKCAPHNP